MSAKIKSDRVGFGELHKSGITKFSDTDLIAQYTRADAISEGVLIDLTKDFPITKRVYKFPVAVTQAVWAILNSTPSEWIIGEVIALIVASNTKKIKIIDEASHLFEVVLEGAAPSDRFTFKIICHGDDNGDPCLTISLPEED